MNSENQIPHNIGGCPDVKDLPPNLFNSSAPHNLKSTYPSLQMGKWYWIEFFVVRTYEYYESAPFKRKELQKCLQILNTKEGEMGVFETNSNGINYVLVKNCFLYDGPMKKEFIFWGAEIPDV